MNIRFGRILSLLILVVSVYGCDVEEPIGRLEFHYSNYFSFYINPDNISLEPILDNSLCMEWHYTGEDVIRNPKGLNLPYEDYIIMQDKYDEQAAAHMDADEKKLTTYGTPKTTFIVLGLTQLRVIEEGTNKDVSALFKLRYLSGNSLVTGETEFPVMKQIEKRLDQITGEDLYWLGFESNTQGGFLIPQSAVSGDLNKYLLVAEFEGRDPIIVPLAGAAGDK